ncbi:TetR/AcrR family transcriptional regulator [Nocardia sp. NBC_01503]|uniref:TetR/AcrR family transcriptional regulator n=1 Tax=Nocardia sp. NBC_01503 TaxID=2975997 RepID=UPI002E7AEBB9|nr:TetR/AcrR family transcriptional regulator [Nocardia sp. NBC_01503]WTL35720.1 TetR/AcrR family transcriptional regulator [Nocardia sp. NBC_01503]
MSPRQYNLGKRTAQIEQSRRQVIDAARALLGEADSYHGFTLDAVAKRADVSRATVYYQFGSKTGLLEAVCDDLGVAGGLSELVKAFTNPEPLAALAEFIACFARFWQADRPAMRRLRALAALDAEVHAVISARDERRREGLAVLSAPFADPDPSARDTAQQVRILLALTSFETFDTMAGPDGDLFDAVPAITGLAATVLGVNTEEDSATHPR